MKFSIPFPNKKYKTIVTDPAWDIQPMKLKKYQLSVPYKTMTMRELQLMPIEDLADEDCGLFMWTTHTFLPKSLKLMEDWGFKYHCTLTWNKVSGLSHQGIFRVTEFVLFGYRGKIKNVINQKGKYIPALFKESKGRHSSKPKIFDDYIRSNTPEPRLEMFARVRKEGFDVIGNEVGFQEALE